MREQVIRAWYRPRLNFFTVILLPFSFLFALLVYIRRACYRVHLLKTTRCSVPVIVVGNLTVGGTGKTPLIAYLANFLKAAGYRPGIISRAYPFRNQQARWVNVFSDPVNDGDEPVMLAKQLDCPIVVSANRVRAAKALLKKRACNVLLSDDGLQHYALARDIEIVVIDGERRFGNRQCLPAGPLREPLSRLKNINFLVNNGSDAQAGEFSMQLLPAQQLHAVENSERTLSLSCLQGEEVHAVAGIGNPARFFQLLRSLGLRLIEHPFPDHHVFSEKDLAFPDARKIIMTEKDAVKCIKFANPKQWFLPVRANLPSEFGQSVLKTLQGVLL